LCPFNLPNLLWKFQKLLAESDNDGATQEEVTTCRMQQDIS